MTHNEALHAAIDLVTSREIGGYVFDPVRPEIRFVVELWLDGAPAGFTRADLFDERLREAGLDDGCRRFLFALDGDAAGAAGLAEVRLANTGRLVGAPIALAALPATGPVSVAEARWEGGLRLTGRVVVGDGDLPIVRALFDGVVVAEAPAMRWAHVERDGQPLLARAFELRLPEVFADGRIRRIRVIDSAGLELPGSPVAVLAFADGLEAWLAERGDAEADRLRGRAFDRMFPRSLPFLDYEAWRGALDSPQSGSLPAVAIVLAGDGDAAASVLSLQSTGQGGALVMASGGDDAVSLPPGALARWLAEEAQGCGVVVFAPAGFRFASAALGRLVSSFDGHPAATVAYGDLEIAAPDGRPSPLALPAFDYERWLEQGYCAYAFALRTTVARNAALVEAGDLFDLFRRALEPVAHEPLHVPGILGRLPAFDPRPVAHRLAVASERHLAARGFEAAVVPRLGRILPAARVRRSAALRPRVSIVIPTRDRPDLLRPCIESIERTTADDNVEILVADNGSARPETAEYLDAVARRGHRVAIVPGPFNFARIVNAAASVASGEHLLLCNDDVEAISPGWLLEMTDRARDPSVGAVGAVLHWPSGVVQHGGVVLGPNFAVAHAFDDRRDDDPGYADMLVVAHECSAVTAACLLTPRARFVELGGLDAATFAVDFNDVDYCLRLRARRLRVVLTPHARLLHRESASRGALRQPDRIARRERELAALRLRWGDALRADPFYSPWLALDGRPYSGLALPPRDLSPRTSHMPPPWAAPWGL